MEGSDGSRRRPARDRSVTANTRRRIKDDVKSQKHTDQTIQQAFSKVKITDEEIQQAVEASLGKRVKKLKTNPTDPNQSETDTNLGVEGDEPYELHDDPLTTFTQDLVVKKFKEQLKNLGLDDETANQVIQGGELNDGLIALAAETIIDSEKIPNEYKTKAVRDYFNKKARDIAEAGTFGGDISFTGFKRAQPTQPVIGTIGGITDKEDVDNPEFLDELERFQPGSKLTGSFRPNTAGILKIGDGDKIDETEAFETICKLIVADFPSQTSSPYSAAEIAQLKTYFVCYRSIQHIANVSLGIFEPSIYVKKKNEKDSEQDQNVFQTSQKTPEVIIDHRAIFTTFKVEDFGAVPFIMVPIVRYLIRRPAILNAPSVATHPVLYEYIRNFKSKLFGTQTPVPAMKTYYDKTGEILNHQIKSAYDTILDTIGQKVDNQIWNGNIETEKRTWDLWIESIAPFADRMLRNTTFQTMPNLNKAFMKRSYQWGSDFDQRKDFLRVVSFGKADRNPVYKKSFEIATFDCYWTRQIASMAIFNPKKSFADQTFVFGYNLVWGIARDKLLDKGVFKSPFYFPSKPQGADDKLKECTDAFVALFPEELEIRDQSTSRLYKYAFSVVYYPENIESMDKITYPTSWNENCAIVVHMKMRQWKTESPKVTFEFVSKLTLGSIFYKYYGNVRKQKLPPQSNTTELQTYADAHTLYEISNLVEQAKKNSFTISGVFIGLSINKFPASRGSNADDTGISFSEPITQNEISVAFLRLYEMIYFKTFSQIERQSEVQSTIAPYMSKEDVEDYEKEVDIINKRYKETIKELRTLQDNLPKTSTNRPANTNQYLKYSNQITNLENERSAKVRELKERFRIQDSRESSKYFTTAGYSLEAPLGLSYYKLENDYLIAHIIAKATLSRWFYGKRKSLEKLNDNRLKVYLNQDSRDMRKVLRFFGSGIK